MIQKEIHIYLAGPDVFMPNTLEIGRKKKALLESKGYKAHYPMDNQIEPFKQDSATAMLIAKENELLMKKSHIILLNMTPWHGPSMDVGTAFEAGFMSAKAEYQPENILIIGYYEKEVELNFAKRIASLYFTSIDKVRFNPDGSAVDYQGNTLENFGLSENLMIEASIAKTGGEKFLSFEEAVNAIERLWSRKQDI